METSINKPTATKIKMHEKKKKKIRKRNVQ